MRNAVWKWVGWALLTGLVAPGAWADSDHDRARAALVAGEVLPLAEVLQRVARQHPGHVLEVELEREHGRWVYELKLLQADGGVLKLEVDARDGTVLRRRSDGQGRR
ncbi:PepSY domain-containing protein [Aquabacterium sp. A08]|uniref:PepSY domain-containing protein n=1 Tax=Aquabacterium sp. A08 TaxID=2718532 RepID=UPI001422FC77|nr:PepSY domain-containing protein [Aquabacterium sp. A08]NIC40041.1 PepSY domain-containing protein [Aquabacterium sp. A08]